MFTNGHGCICSPPPPCIHPLTRRPPATLTGTRLGRTQGPAPLSWACLPRTSELSPPCCLRRHHPALVPSTRCRLIHPSVATQPTSASPAWATAVSRRHPPAAPSTSRGRRRTVSSHIQLIGPWERTEHIPPGLGMPPCLRRHHPALVTSTRCRLIHPSPRSLPVRHLPGRQP